MNLERLLGLILLVLTISVYWQVQDHEFVHFDDPAYVTDNRHVQYGLSKEGFFWAFQTFHVSNWHPITWLSHMLDFHLYGFNPAGHHLVNVFLHAANSLLLFLFLRETTGCLWRGFFVSALFALHPLHVESVAWIAERKDVLSTFFFFLTLLTYSQFVKRPRIDSYGLSLFLFALGLMSKPMLVTLPFVLLLLDYWPLNRLQMRGDGVGTVAWKLSHVKSLSLGKLFLEKIPFFVFAVGSSVVTVVAQTRAIQPLESFTLKTRFLNACASCVDYLIKTLWPKNLSVFYPHPGNRIELWPGVAAFIFLISISVLTLQQIRKRPYFFIGWVWFLGTMVPVIGFVQVGLQAMADRYTYIPLVGVFVAVVWGLADWFEHFRVNRIVVALFAVMVLCATSTLTWFQAGYWKNTATLFQHAVKVTKDNYAAHFILAREEGKRGATVEAFRHYNQAVEINPSFVSMMHNRLGYHLAEQGKMDEAITQFKGALDLFPNYANAHNNLGAVLAEKGNLKQALVHFSKALEINPKYSRAQKNLENAKKQMAILGDT